MNLTYIIIESIYNLEKIITEIEGKNISYIITYSKMLSAITNVEFCVYVIISS